MKTGVRLLRLLAASVACAGLGSPLRAAPLCEGPPEAIRPFLPDGCQSEQLEVTGDLSFNLFRTASELAENAWEREARKRYGERFQDLGVAACKIRTCANGAVSGTQRCKMSAFPCASDMDATAKEKVERLSAQDEGNALALRVPPAAPSPAVASAPELTPEVPSPAQPKEKPAQEEPARIETPAQRELTPQEVREMQRLLLRGGYKVRADGVFGDQSHEALKAFERKAGLPENGLPTVEMLERLRRDIR